MIEGIRPDEENTRAKLEEETLNMNIVHTEELHDLDEDVFGEKINLATGEVIDNSSDDPGSPEMFPVEDTGDENEREDALPPILEKEDAAAKFIREYEEAEKLKENKNKKE